MSQPKDGWLGWDSALLSCQLHPGGGGGDESENNPLGSLQKGSIDIVGAEMQLVDRPGGVVTREEVLDKIHSDFVQIWSIRIIKLFYLKIFAHLFHYNSSFIVKGS